MRIALTALGLVLALPVLGVLAAWLQLDAAALQTLQHLWQTVLPEQALQSFLLAGGVGVGVAMLGGATAAAVSLFQFPGRRVFEWALLLPLAMPAYVLAYATTDALQPSGPVQAGLRAAFGWQGALWPDVRSLPFAVCLFVLALYPYVYVLARTSLAERAVPLMEAARLLGAGLRRRLFEVALPLARPALAAGVLLALMETLADFGVGAYFGLTTFTTGIYKAWLVMNDGTAAAQLASSLLAVVACLLWLERRAQARLRFATARSGSAHAGDARLMQPGAAAATALFALCSLPVVLGFVLPSAWLAVRVWQEAQQAEFGLPLQRFALWAWHSFALAGAAALLAAAIALAFGAVLRAERGAGLSPLRLSARTVSLGYAVPGAVIAVGMLAPLGALQARWPDSGAGVWLTATVLGLLYAYVVRFSAVAMQSVEAGYARIPPAVDDSARLLGAGVWRIWFEVHRPLLRRAALAAMLLVFVDVMKELPATLLLRPFGIDTLATVAYNFARDERLAEAALPSLAMVVVGLIPVALLSRAMRRAAVTDA
jgi:iron(III) transport system permease protein